ncbi:hypothetical protein [Sphingobium bisphenolivorans]|uniref:hypothetical protein n=1 Tax=Sphingobium bisphenolivorans TaxID=1335760 RepID=UPI0003A65F42|nr:hypothetical protein [Sphingobium bisphenolivorans]
MKIIIDESPTGSGKTYRVLEDITKESCKVLFIVERIERFSELRQEIVKLAAVQGTHPTIVDIHSNSRSRTNSVSRRIEAIPDDYRLYRHVIVLATHAAMLRSDFSGFAGWQIIVDEVPNFLDFEQKQTHLDQAYFEKFYELKPLDGEWYAVVATPAGIALTAADVRADESHSHLAVFHRRVLDASRPDATRFVLCNLPDWTAMADKKVQWCWASAFSLWELQAFDRITLLGNRFRADIGSMISATLDVEAIEWSTRESLKGKRDFHHRVVNIQYFSEHRCASRNLFDSASGQVMLNEIGAYLAGELNGVECIWTANDPANDDSSFEDSVSARKGLEAAGLSPSNYLSPRQAGTNAHQKKSHVAAIYSAKPAPNLIALLKALNIPVEYWTRSIEHETILQFVTRTSIRDEGNSSPVHIWVFDREQALYLKEYFDGLVYVAATMKKVENGPEIPLLERRGPKTTMRTPEEKAAYDAEKRRRDAERKREARAKAKALKKAA